MTRPIIGRRAAGLTSPPPTWLVLRHASAVGALTSSMCIAADIPMELRLRFLLLSALLLVVHGCGLPHSLDSFATCLLFSSAVLSASDAYRNVWWLDDAAHIVVPSSLALGSAYVVERHLRRAGLNVIQGAAGVITTVIVVMALGLAFASAWELYEWCVVLTFGPGTVWTSYQDTMSDIAQGAGGAALVGVATATHAMRRSKVLSETLLPAPGILSPAGRM